LIVVSGGSAEGGTLVEAELLRDDVETGVTEEGYPYRGPADAPVTLVEFSDYNCPHCRTFALETAPLVDEELVATGQLKWVVEPYYLWDWSRPIVEAAMCAEEQGGFWDYRQWLFANAERFPPQRSPSRGLLLELAEASGLDTEAFDACLDDGRFRDAVVAATEAAKLQRGINSTPTIFVNGVQTPATIEGIRSAVQAALGAGSIGSE
jgi:protein-disulfide isomerase